MGVLLSDSVLHACDIVFDVRNAVPAIFGAELDDGRADDHDRISMIAKEANGFIYCVSSLGVTGTRSKITPSA